MKSTLTWIFNTILLAVFVVSGVAVCEVTLDPFGFAISVENAGAVETTIQLNNTGDDDIEYNFNYEILEEGNLRREGPARDELGDLIDQFNPPLGGNDRQYASGLAWDQNNNWMWITESDNYLIVAVDPADNYNGVARFNGPGSERDGSSGAAWYDNVLYLIGWTNHAWVYRYDTDGNNIGNFQIPASAGAVATSVEEGWLFAMSSNREIYVYDIEDEFEPIGQFNDYQQFLEGQLAQSMCWVDGHRNGQLWVNTRNGNNNDVAWQIRVDTDNWECVELVQSYESDDVAAGHPRDGIGHDGQNLWLANYSSPAIRIIDDGVSEVSLLSFEPESGMLNAEGLEDVTITILPEGFEPGVYHAVVSLELATPDEMQDEPFEVVNFSAVISVDSPVANVTGVIMDAVDGTPLENVRVDLDAYIITRFSDDEGGFLFQDLPTGEYELTIMADDFLPLTVELQIDEPGDIEIAAELLHSECLISLDNVTIDIAPGDEYQVGFEVANEGNGPLSLTTERRLIGNANVDPWSLREQLFVGAPINDDRIQGAVYVNDMFYVAGGNDRDPMIYVLNQEGELIDQFTQPGEGRYGMRDLAWDGELIWGSGEEQIYGFTLDGELQVQFEGPYNPNHDIAYDPDRNVLWVSSTTSDYTALDLEGNQIETFDRGGLRTYGLAYWPEDPDDQNLYIFARETEIADQIVYKMSTDNGDITMVDILEPEGGGTPIGCFITNSYDIYSWVFLSVTNNGDNDRLDIWQLDARKDWMQIEPAAGVIDPGENMDFSLTLDSGDLPGAQFEGEIVFVHDGIGGETALPITMNIIEGPVEADRTLQLEVGWNMISVNVQPEDDDVTVITSDLVEAGQLTMMKNGIGEFYRPEFNFNNIPGWDVAQGYQFKMSEEAELTVHGLTVMADDPISLVDGWNLVSYFPRVPVDAIVALSGIEEQLVMAKDGRGNFYNPEFGFSNMGELEEGQGYQIKMNGDLELVYNINDDDGLMRNFEHIPEQRFSVPNTGSNMSLLLINDSSRNGEIQVFAGDLLVGAGSLQAGMTGLAVYGDDPSTEVIDGARQGEILTLKYTDSAGESLLETNTLRGGNSYQTDAFWAVGLDQSSFAPVEYRIDSIYPNPFNSRSVIKYSIPEYAVVDLSVFDARGRLVESLVKASQKPGYYNVVFDGGNLSSGVYIVRLNAGSRIINQKVAMIR